ncbi:MAG: UDP-glucose 4-epimerase GalE [Candidatus Auribacterota bacterium]
MNVLVTGGAGYIGSVTSEQLIESGHKVIVIDNLIKGHKEAVHPDAVFYDGDINNEPLVGDILRKHQIDAVMHFAADALVGESMQDPDKYFSNNVVNGFKLVQTAAKNKVKKFIFSSTCATYGEPEQIPIPETHLQKPCNPYGESKLILEKIIRWYAEIFGFEYVFLRYFNACGASDRYGEDHDPETHIIPIVLQAAIGQREQVMVMGDDYPTPDGTCIRDYIHVLDLAAAHILALEHKGSGFFNLGNMTGFSVMEVIKIAEKITGRKIKFTMAPRRPGDPAQLVGSSEKIRKELGWNPRFTSLEQMIESAWKWKLKHPEGYKK